LPDPIRVPLHGVPPGLVAIAVTKPDGTVPRDRKGRAVPKQIVLTADGSRLQAAPGEAGDIPVPADEVRWLTASPTRRWTTVESRLDDTSWDVVVELARAGVLTVDCTVAGLHVGPPVAVTLAADWAALCKDKRAGRAQHVAGLRERALALAPELETVDIGLAAALAAARGHEKTLPVLVAAAEDLLAGVVHDGPRAFSQAHFGDTKARDDAPAILTAAGVFPQALAALGLTRSPYVGLGGAVVVSGRTGEPTDLWQFPGPVRFRVDPDPDGFSARPEPDDRSVTLAVIENLQAAETVCDVFGLTVAVLWCAGQPADRPVDLIAELAARAGRVLIAPDADLGGVRIAARVAHALPPGTAWEILDAGTVPHEARDPFGAASRDGLGRIERDSPDPRVCAFAAAVLERGYPVEQEASARAVLAAALR
jgi:hypothetical protein